MYEDEIKRLTNEITGLNFKFDTTSNTVEAERANRETRLAIKRIEYKKN
jgi:hypothetical protein